MPKEDTMPEVTLAARLKVYGLDPAKLAITNLEVPAGKEIVLRADDRKYAKQVQKLVPKDIADLKRWIGVPNAGFKKPVLRPQPLIPARPKFTPTDGIALRKLAKQYVYGHSDSVSPDQLPALNKWLVQLAGYVVVFVLSDIHVAAGATLTVNAGVPILFANNITVEKGGKILMKATNAKIDCTGIKCL
jgi:hypothetical protein